MILCSELSTCMPSQEKLSVPLTSELVIFKIPKAPFSTILRLAVTLTFDLLTSNLISLSLSPIALYCKFCDVPTSSF